MPLATSHSPLAISAPRLPDWTIRLDAYIEACRDRPFAWGEHDCALFALDAIDVMTGRNLAAEFRGKYTNERSALRLLRWRFGGGLAEAAEQIARREAFSEIPTKLAQRGDVVLLPGEFGEALGIVSLDGRLALGLNTEGLRALPIGQALRAWRV